MGPLLATNVLQTLQSTFGKLQSQQIVVAADR